MVLSADGTEAAKARAISLVSESSHTSGRSPCREPERNPGSSSRSSARITPSFPAAAQDSRAASRPSTPMSCSPDAPRHRHSFPAAVARAAARSAPGGRVSQVPPLANPASSSSRGTPPEAASAPGVPGPSRGADEQPGPSRGADEQEEFGELGELGELGEPGEAGEVGEVGEVGEPPEPGEAGEAGDPEEAGGSGSGSPAGSAFGSGWCPIWRSPFPFDLVASIDDSTRILLRFLAYCCDSRLTKRIHLCIPRYRRRDGRLGGDDAGASRPDKGTGFTTLGACNRINAMRSVVIQLP